MIDEKKIEETARTIKSKYGMKSESFCNGVYVGAKEGLEYFLKGLWHDACEEPMKDANCLVYINCEYEDTPEDNYNEYTTSVYLGGSWSEDHFPSEADVFILKWCYLDDILPQKGGSDV